MSNMLSIINTSFIQYAGSVLQSRALVDVRDCLKPSARQIFYALFTDKFISDKPYKKTLKAIGSASRFYIHGDSSAVGILMRAGQPFAMRYPIMDVKGNVGTLIESGNWASQRYTESRLAKLANQLFTDVDKDTIDEWRDNYDDTEQYPAVLPSKGFYNIVNGCMGIGVGAASSIPQFNLNEVNDALIKLLWNPDISYDEIACMPDFATGAVLLNASEVKESLRTGTGFACKLRAVVEFDSKDRCLIVKEIPYGVYTNTICGELEAILNSEDSQGIERFNDLTGEKPLIKIYLSKKANPDKVLRYLYKNTSLQTHYGVNMTMLKDGRFPRVYGWKDALSEHIKHEFEVYTRSFTYDLNKIKARLHIVEGLLIAMAKIEEVIQVIKSSSSTAIANTKLQECFCLTATQAKAILDMKLSRLAHLEVQKLTDERDSLLARKVAIETILSSETLMKKEIEKGLLEVKKQYGDARRTQILNIEKEEDEPIEVRTLMLDLTNMNNIFVQEASSLYTQKRGGVGAKFKLEQGEYVLSSISVETVDKILFFSNKGNYYHYQASALPVGEKIAIESLFMPKVSGEKICEMTAYDKNSANSHIIFFTKEGMMKKSMLAEYNPKRGNGAKAIELGDTDEICSVVINSNEPVGVLTKKGQFLIFNTKDVRPIGRVGKGVKSIKLDAGDVVVCARTIPTGTNYIASVSKKGLTKKTAYSEFVIGTRYTKGSKLQKLKEETDTLASFIPLTVEDKEIAFVSAKAKIQINVSQIPELSKGAQGVKSMALRENDNIITITNF